MASKTLPNPVVESRPARHGWIVRQYADGHFDAAHETTPAISPGFDSREEANAYINEAVAPYVRISRALGNMPYLPLASWYSKSSEPEDLARTLEELAVVLSRIAAEHEAEHVELVNLRNDVAAVRRVFGADHG